MNLIFPNFLIIGVQKSATSWLSVNLNEHDEIKIERREGHFFNNPEYYKRGISWYAERFDPQPGIKAFGEKTPEYMWVKEGVGQRNGHNFHVPELVYQHFPEMRLIVILRDPVERALSAYLYFVRGGDISPFSRFRSAIDRFGILEMGCYYNQLLYWKKYFPDNQILIFIKETDVDCRPGETLKKCCSFLGVNPDVNFSKQSDRVNVGWTDIEIIISYYLKYHQGIRQKYKKVRKKLHPYFSVLRQRAKKTGLLVSQSDCDFLYNYYSKDYAKLEELLEVDLSMWRRE